ncbi:MAG: glutamine--fructose-6-phosphate transaminase (isomerizing), partial [Alphaproteobacteria bacterium]|nr:glutamine--fructose-6-phosphate transaminase (isomerizing) [Alphaproteobacteria bacterium]MDX5370173.1 glutamine--fructose-6-phosphate transaminase (isomerizing) [Alphaproteobacteria bacterium]MDX5464735.1 glutamine--fructose-6-phosphate transaminase (isomerizing) [Alphaproteobacteria bacterium]
MCGIVGILGKDDVAPRLVEALKRLEYRGYDSAGVATVVNGHIERRRASGKLGNLAGMLQQAPIAGAVGIGHTRWATHGSPTEGNAHPHATDRVAVVHNGIIENFRELRRELEAEGAVFASETDTETVVHLVTKYLNTGLTPQDAAAATLSRLEGAFALAFIFRGEHDLMVAARRGSPLAIGWGEGEMYVGSDALALAPMTNRVTYLEDGDWAVLTREGALIHDEAGNRVERPVKVVSVSSVLVDKGNHRHFMAKEIHEQPEVVGHTLSTFYRPMTETVELPAAPYDWAALPKVTMVACGTAHFACAVAKYWFEQVARLPAETDIASEFRYRNPPLVKGGLSLFVSQSGETIDTLTALRLAKEQGQHIAGIVNVPESAIARESDVLYPTNAGPEIGVASTKAFTCQLTTLALLAIAAGEARGSIDANERKRLTRTLAELPRLMNVALHLDEAMGEVAHDLAKARDVLYLGRGAMYPLALEGALKLKEISYIHAEGYASGELKHGPIALIDENVPVIVLAPSDELFDKTVSNMQEVMARGGRVILITDRTGAERAGDSAWHTIVLPDADPFVAPILYSIPIQLLAYHTAVAKGT